MEEFTASNGVEITITSDGDEAYLLGKGEVRPGGEGRWTVATGGGEGVEALREFFRHERDQELGRWRWPENPDVVVQADEGGERAWVVNERNPRINGCVWRVDIDYSTAHAQVVAAARAYFAAHPEPKPWHDAKHLEIWALTIQGCPSEAYIYREGFARRETAFRPVNNEERVQFSADDQRITAGRRIWPEVSGDV